jgi:ketosteroid isomerase-like protein
MQDTGAMRGVTAFVLVCVLMAACSESRPRPDGVDLRQQVMDTERAFAKTMADRDFAAFQEFLSPEAVFFSGQEPTTGKADVARQWKSFYEKPEAPFSWAPEKVVVLPSGKLALSTGPVRDKNGVLIATFTSIWRLEAPGTWRIVFDKGNGVCDCKKSP